MKSHLHSLLQSGEEGRRDSSSSRFPSTNLISTISTGAPVIYTYMYILSCEMSTSKFYREQICFSGSFDEKSFLHSVQVQQAIICTCNASLKSNPLYIQCHPLYTKCLSQVQSFKHSNVSNIQCQSKGKSIIYTMPLQRAILCTPNVSPKSNPLYTKFQSQEQSFICSISVPRAILYTLNVSAKSNPLYTQCQSKRQSFRHSMSVSRAILYTLSVSLKSDPYTLNFSPKSNPLYTQCQSQE